MKLNNNYEALSNDAKNFTSMCSSFDSVRKDRVASLRERNATGWEVRVQSRDTSQWIFDQQRNHRDCSCTDIISRIADTRRSFCGREECWRENRKKSIRNVTASPSHRAFPWIGTKRGWSAASWVGRCACFVLMAVLFVSVAARGFGMRVVGGKTGSDGRTFACIVWTVPGGPAEKAGLQQGDKVIPTCFAISRFLAAVRGREIGGRFRTLVFRCRASSDVLF